VHRRVCRSRQSAFWPREARPRQSGGSKARAFARVRVNGGLATGGRTRARERMGRWGREGGGASGLGDPHHVSAEGSTRAAWLARTPVRATRATQLPMEGTSDRESARLSRGSRGTGLGFLRARARGEATEVPEAAFRARGAEEDAATRASPGRRSGLRAVKRGAPRPRSHRVAPSPPLPARPSPDGRRGAQSTLRGRARGERLGTRAIRRATPKGAARIQRTAALGSDEARVLESGRFGVQKSIGRIVRPRRPRAPIRRTRTRAA
jgi:hypothetical protein